MKKQIIISKNVEKTQKIAKDFVQSIKSGAFLALYGNLGSGKTTFTQGLAKGLGINRRIISPTFTIIRSYKFKSSIFAKATADKQNFKTNRFFHIDLYRIEDQKNLESLGIGEVLNDPQNIVVVEWAERLGKLLPEKRIDIKLEYLRDENKRKITIKIKTQK